MKLNQKQFDTLVHFTGTLIINVVIFLIGAFLTDMKLGIALLYSLINAVWMTFLLVPILPRINKVFEKKKKGRRQPI